MVRVAGLTQLIRGGVVSRSADGLTPGQQMGAINEALEQLQDEQQRVWRDLVPELAAAGISIVSLPDLSDGDVAFLQRHFLDEVWLQLTPQSVDPAHPFPFIPGKGMGLIFTLTRGNEAGGGSAGTAAAASPAAAPAASSPRGSGDDHDDHDDDEDDDGDGGDDDVHGTLRDELLYDFPVAGAAVEDRGKPPEEMKAILLIPPRLRRFIRLPAAAGGATTPALNLTGSNRASAAGTRSQSSPAAPPLTRFIPIEDVLRMHLQFFFPDFAVAEEGMFRILRDSEVEVDEEAVDLVRMFESALKRRRKGQVIHLTVDAAMPAELRAFLASQLGVTRDQLTVLSPGGIVGLADVKGLIVEDRKELLFEPFIVRTPERVARDHGGDIFAAIRAKDMVIHHPFESFDSVLQFVRQASRDPTVVAIKQTLYRTSEDSPIVQALIEAAEGGKTVTALIELKARFDEEANIRWARDMERAGVQVVYGFVELKTHAKVSMVVRREADGLRSYVHFGTGNYHPYTARVYTDLSLFTADPVLGRDANRLFNFMTGYGRPTELEAIAVAPVSLRSTLESMIRAEIANARAGRPAAIWAKLNSLVDAKIIALLYEASEAGVSIDIIVRGMCALRPGVAGLSSRIRVKSIIGRFLEHARIVVFANGSALPGPNVAVYISSADWMTRNLDWRVEALVPIRNPTVHTQILDEIMTHNMLDEANSWTLGPDGEYARVVEPRARGAPGGGGGGSGGAGAGSVYTRADGTTTAGDAAGDGGAQDGLPHDAHQYFMTTPSHSGRGRSKEHGDGGEADDPSKHRRKRGRATPWKGA
jgi:polyphosphate kinase 1